jgi:transcriptional regulator with XRE-family HTH domain
MAASNNASKRKESDAQRQEASSRLALGKRIRRRREEKNLSITELSQLTGLTASFISQAETGKTGLSINTLRAMSHALDVPIFHFLLDEDDTIGVVVRKDQRPVLELPHSNIRYELLMPNLNLNLEVFIGYLAPGCQSTDTPHGHASDECLLILQGQMDFALGDEHHVLRAGDSISYDGRIPHRAVNSGSEELIFVAAISPPNF